MNSATSSKHVIFVLGMHRSGTSAITRGLETLGVNLGSNLRTPRSENPKGFWEDLDFNDINSEILKMFNLDWQQPGIIAADQLLDERFDALRKRAREFLRKRMEQSDIVGLKDPRASRVLPFWKAAIREVGAQPGYIIAARNPLCVAQSLKARDGFITSKGIMLWLEYMLESLLHTEGETRIVVEYDAILDSPASELQRMAHALDLKFDMNSATFLDYSRNFLSKSLRTTKFTENDLHSETSIPSIVKDTYIFVSELSRMDTEKNILSTKEKIDSLHSFYKNNFLFFTDHIKTKEASENDKYTIQSLKNKITFLESEIHENIKRSKFSNLIFKIKSELKSLNFKKNFHNFNSATYRHLKSLILLIKNIRSKQELKNLFKEVRMKFKGNN